jgi:hypothetical protein
LAVSGGNASGRGWLERLLSPITLATLLLGIAVLIASLWLPLQAIATVVDKMSGKNTNFNVNIALTVGLTLAVSGGIGAAGIAALRRKINEQRGELERTRGRLESLQERLEACDKERKELISTLAPTRRRAT